MRTSALSLGAALLALACSGCDHTRAPANGSAAAPAAAPAASVAQAQPPAGAASIESAPPAATAAPTAVAAKPAPATPPAAPVAAPVAGSPADVHRISLAEANALREQGRAVIVDVRDKGSYDAGHIAGALHIPVDALVVRMNELPHDKPIITYCA